MQDLYALLGVAPDASEEEIKRAYRRKARETHPDAGGDENAFKEVTTAYEVLRNPQARENYDRYGDPRGPGGASDPFAGAGFGDLSDLIDAFFGGGGFGGSPFGSAQPRQRGGRDVVVDARLTLEEAFSGIDHEVTLDLARTCATCDGSGARPGSAPVRCQTCDGQGAVQQVARSVFGQVLTSKVCPACQGAGTTIPEPCEDCRGEGRRSVREEVAVHVPAGVEDGTRLRLAGRGEAGRQGARPGDLYVRVHVRPHEVFEREGNDLRCRLRLPMVQAALGVVIPIPTIEGTTDLEVPAGTQPGSVLTVRRAGMPKLNGGGARGDLYVEMAVEIPRNLDTEERTLLESFAAHRGEDEPLDAVAGKGLFGRLRDAFGA